MTTWGDFKTQVRRTVINDETKWSDDQLLDAVGWALDQFCAHTAAPTSVTFSMATPTTMLTVPDNAYGNIQETSLLAYINSSDDRIEYLEPTRLIPGSIWANTTVDNYTTPEAWWEWPKGTINLRFLPQTNTSMTLYYFAYYNKPSSDSDTIDVPRWAEYALGLLVGAFLFLPEATKSALIRQYNTKVDSGTPEHSPLNQQARLYLELYYDWIGQQPNQQRERFFKEGRGL